MTTDRLIQDIGTAIIKRRQLDRICHAAKTFEGFTTGADIADINGNLDRFGTIKLFVTREFEQRLIGLDPTLTAIAHIEFHRIVGIVKFDIGIVAGKPMSYSFGFLRTIYGLS